MEDLTGKIAVVTGAAGGIGNALAHRFAARGMKVVLADIGEAALAQAEQTLRADGAEVIGVVTDVSDAESVEALARTTIEHFGAVHVVCNNAGVGGADGSPAWVLPLTEWEWVLGVNFYGVLHGMRSFLPLMLEAGEGHMVNTASFAGLRPTPTLAPYAASKHAVVALTETAFHELRAMKSAVGISVICPAPVATNIADSYRNRPERFGGGAVPEGDQKEFVDFLRAVLAQGLPPDEVAGHVLDAITENRFWILTHEDTRRVVLERAAIIAEGRDPIPGM